jgi:hypothetical protein
MARSRIVPRRTAERTPDRIPSTSQITAAPSARERVIGNACLRIVDTGCEW